MVDQIPSEVGRPQFIVSPKSKSTALLLSWLIGFLGADRFYLGDVGLG
ncbi:TM2 domain-containing protein, partial [candidate division KSB1 bacterium]|nr:TM2 domain-containing protein [candidate division KSB1 bacterium]